MTWTLLLTLAFSLSAPASAEPGRYDALKTLAQALPERNPRPVPGDLGERGDYVPREMCSCRFVASDMAAVEELVGLIKEYLRPGGKGKAALLAEIRNQFPEMSDGDYSQLSMGIRFAPGTTLGHLIKESCRLLLRQYFDSGATREQLLAAIQEHHARLDLAAPPK